MLSQKNFADAIREPVGKLVPKTFTPNVTTSNAESPLPSNVSNDNSTSPWNRKIDDAYSADAKGTDNDFFSSLESYDPSAPIPAIAPVPNAAPVSASQFDSKLNLLLPMSRAAPDELPSKAPHAATTVKSETLVRSNHVDVCASLVCLVVYP